MGATACDVARTSADAPTSVDGEVEEPQLVKDTKEDAASEIRQAQLNSDIRAREQRNDRIELDCKCSFSSDFLVTDKLIYIVSPALVCDMSRGTRFGRKPHPFKNPLQNLVKKTFFLCHKDSTMYKNTNSMSLLCKIFQHPLSWK